jgi:predicted phage baseplate assembly protein
VKDEVLGSGDGTVASQSFTLKKSPLTYFAGGSGGTVPWRSTLTVKVDGQTWDEVENFVGQSPTAQVYVTSQNPDGTTTVSFGDGIEGARLSTGTGNVLATYRYGAGAQAPDVGSLTSIVTSVTGLTGVKNPVAVIGGVDAEVPGTTKTNAPVSVLAFDRAISLDDFEAIALEVGATRATAYYTWDKAKQKAVVTVYVGDDDNAVAATKGALAAAVDPSISYTVLPFKRVQCSVAVVLRVDPKFDASTLQAAVQSALLDPAGALFGTGAAIGDAIYESQIAAVCMSVRGVLEVTMLGFEQGGLATVIAAESATGSVPAAETKRLIVEDFLRAFLPNERHWPGEGGLYSLVPENLFVAVGANDGLGS